MNSRPDRPDPVRNRPGANLAHDPRPELPPTNFCNHCGFTDDSKKICKKCGHRMIPLETKHNLIGRTYDEV